MALFFFKYFIESSNGSTQKRKQLEIISEFMNLSYFFITDHNDMKMMIELWWIIYLIEFIDFNLIAERTVNFVFVVIIITFRVLFDFQSTQHRV